MGGMGVAGRSAARTSMAFMTLARTRPPIESHNGIPHRLPSLDYKTQRCRLIGGIVVSDLRRFGTIHHSFCRFDQLQDRQCRILRECPVDKTSR